MHENSVDLFNLPLFLRWKVSFVLLRVNFLHSKIHRKLALIFQAKIIDSNNEQRTAVGQSLATLNQLGVTVIWPPESANEFALSETAETFKIFGPERPLKLNNKGFKSIHLENALSYSLLHEHNVMHSFYQNRYG